MGARKEERKKQNAYEGFRGHPRQGKRPHEAHRAPRERYDPGVWNPYAWIPSVMHPPAAGRSGFAFGDDQYEDAGPFVGMGPKGYARSDQRVFEDVCDLLTEHGELDVRDVTVEVKNGEVTLEGTVPDRWTKRECEDVADDVMGVQDVHNRLRIQSPEKS